MGVRQVNQLALGLVLLAVAAQSCRDLHSQSSSSSSSSLLARSTETGNPRPKTSAAAIASSICDTLVRCSGVDAEDCGKRVQALSGMDARLGLPVDSFNPFSMLTSAEGLGVIAAQGGPSAACVSGIQGLSCSNPRVQAAYDRFAPNPYTGVLKMIPEVGGSCSGVFTPPFEAGVGRVQVVTASLPPWTGAQLSIPLASATRAGSLLVVVVGSSRGTAPVAVADNLGQAYAVASSYANSQSVLDVYYVAATRAGATSVTLNYPDASNAAQVAVLEYTGLALGGILDQTAAYDAAGANSWDVATPAATGVPGELLIGVGFNGWGLATFTPGSGWTPRATQCSTESCLFVQDRIATSAGIYHSTGSSDFTDITAAVLSFK